MNVAVEPDAQQLAGRALERRVAAVGVRPLLTEESITPNGDG
jgi:hypothetical protein